LPAPGSQTGGPGLRSRHDRQAHARDLPTTPHVFNPAEGNMARAGADILVCHFGLTSADRSAATATGLEDCPALTDAMAEAALAVNPDALILFTAARSPSRSMPSKRARARIDGFYGAVHGAPVDERAVDASRVQRHQKVRGIRANPKSGSRFSETTMLTRSERQSIQSEAIAL
jgi:predicted TIM-barrel enzyme